MDTFAGKTAFITGAASGIGLGMAKAFARAGMKVAMADVREKVLRDAAAALAGTGAQVLALPLDVTDRARWQTAVERVEQQLGPVGLLCSNAGVNFVGPTQDATYEDWKFALDVNVGGAINAIKSIVPRMIQRGTGGHVVITSSISGLFTRGGAGVYVTTKFALMGMGESLRGDLAPHGIGVSILCPGPVKSDLFESTVEVRPADLAATGSVPVIPPGVKREHTPIFDTAPEPDEIGERVLRGVRRNDMYIMTHPEFRPVLEARAAALLAALPDEPPNQTRIDATRGMLDTSFYDEQSRKPPPR
jgi:NAD(P)-dependent dehydrogenase (short-subunit alcohol dehydrogenase family)